MPLKYTTATFIIIALVLLLLITALLFIDRNFKKVGSNRANNDHLIESSKAKISHIKQLVVYVSKKNHLLLDLKHSIALLKIEHPSISYQRAINQIKLNINADSDWSLFNCYFIDIYPSFYNTAVQSYPDISLHELHLMALLKLELSNNQIIQILNISSEGIKKARYRLRKKMNLETSQSLEEIISSI